MRPVRLELQGFAAFRTLATIDFSGHDIVAFTGPTGAGKSTIIDGIGFALFGSVARYGNEKLVAPIINSVSSEARVRLDFTVGDTAFTAVRVVRRTATGASTKEARLERGTEVIAGTAAEVSAAVEAILGLTFDQFTKTVVLPQGDFARFLTETAGDRQGLLRRLLGLDLYAQMGTRARQRAREAATESEALRRAIGDVEPVTTAMLDALTERTRVLDGAVLELDEAEVGLSAARENFDDADSVVVVLDDDIDRLRALSVPSEVKELARGLARADKTIAASVATVHATTEALDRMSAERSSLPTTDEAERVVAQHEHLLTLEVSMKDLEAAHTATADALASAITEADRAADRLRTDDAAVRLAEQRAGAAGLAATLSVGDRCPVCTRTIDELPDHDLEDEIDTLRTRLERSRLAVIAATEAVRVATSAEAAALERQVRVLSDVELLRIELEDAGTAREKKAELAAAVNADQKLADARTKLETATSALEHANAAREEWRERERQAQRAFTVARDSVSSLDPPTPSGESIIDDWQALAAWAKAEAARRRAERSAAVTRRAAAKKDVDKHTREVARICNRHLEPSAVETHDPALVLRRESASTAGRLEDAIARHDRDKANLERCDGLVEEHLVADQLGKHLSATGFEQWLMRDVMHDLALRASARLFELSSGSYTLVTDGSDFKIRDHRNADELRNARTLSGGETFLASLSLALALADSITELAVDSTPPIESMFLDEGFGTLDADTLDIVAVAIEDLGSSGRLIGIVTHIRELADRLPARIHIERTPSGSIVDPAASDSGVA